MKKNKSVIYWLLSGCILLFIMVTVGGITRLTNSGLSMTDWHLVTDTFPPLTEDKWVDAFEEYKKFPEYLDIRMKVAVIKYHQNHHQSRTSGKETNFLSFKSFRNCHDTT